MADERDYRLRISLTFPPEAKQYAEEIRELLLPLYQNAVNVNEDGMNTEISYIEVERCGNRLDPPKSCEVIARWEVGKGKVI